MPDVRRAGATFSLDTWDAGPWLASADVAGLLVQADVVFSNEDEAVAITGATGGSEAAARLGERAGHAVVKRGARGAVAAVDGEVFEAPAAAAQIVDATGAGDCFAAGYLWGLLGGLGPPACLVLGNLCGAAAVGAPGGFRAAPTCERLVAAAAEARLDLALP